MFKKALFFGLLALLASASPIFSLTVDEILALKQAGVSEETIQMLLRQEREEGAAAERLGILRPRNGWIVHATPRTEWPEGYSTPYPYPAFVYPFVEFTLPPRTRPRARK